MPNAEDSRQPDLPPDDEDHIVSRYLDFISREMKLHPENITPLSPEMMRRAHELVGDIIVDLDANPGDISLP
jgi:hypothetical protein